MDKMESGLEEVKQGFEVMKQTLLAKMTRLRGKKTDERHNRGQFPGSNEGSENNSLSNTTMAVNEKLDEFRLSAKKVELPVFDGTDPVAWLTRTEN